MPRPGFEPGSSRPQRDVLTTRPSKHLTVSTPTASGFISFTVYPHVIFFYDVTKGGMGGIPPVVAT